MPAIARRARPLLGTFVEIRLRDGSPSIFSAAFAEIERIHRLMSAHLHDSDLGKIAREAHHGWVNVDPTTAEVLRISLEFAELTEGAFDPIRAGCALVHAGRRPCLANQLPDPAATWRDLKLADGKVHTSRPLTIDLGGIAKGYAVDLAAEVITGYGCTGVVNAGGDLRFTGSEERSVTLRKPDTTATRLDLREIPYRALATTASYAFSEEGGNLDLIGDGIPPPAISITVFAETCILADAMTKAVLNLPSNKATALLRQFRCSALILTGDGALHELS
jgi:FAD:protein FMN transferase